MRHAPLALVALLACDGPKEQPPTSQPKPTADATDNPMADAVPDSATEPAATTNTGVLDEASFAALHELTEAEAPPLRGVEIDLGDSKAYLSLPPDAKAPLPAVIVIHEWWGLNPHIKHWSDRLAADGYAALAIDLYGGQVATDRETALQLMKAADAAEAQAVLAAAHAFLASDPRVSATKRGVIGWCFGGGWSLQHATNTAGVDAAVVYYGRLPADAKEIAGLDAPVLGIFGNADTGIPPAAVDAFETVMRDAGKSLQVYRYDDAPHAFANPSSGRYVPAAAEDAWSHTRAFLAQHLKGQTP